MCIQDSRRSYRTYAYATEFNLFGGTRRYHRDYGTYTGISEHILVLQNLYWSYRTYTCIQDLFLSYGVYTCLTDTGVLVGTTELVLIHRYKSTHRYYWTYTYFIDTGVPVGTTELNQIQEYP